MALIINELTVQTKVVDEENNLDKSEIYKILEDLKNENLKLKKKIIYLENKVENLN